MTVEGGKDGGGKIPPFGRDKDFSVIMFLRDDKIAGMTQHDLMQAAAI